MTSNAPFEPDWSSPPGHTVGQLMAAKGLDYGSLSELMGIDQKHIASLLAGASPITSTIASALEKALGSSSSFWVRRESQFCQQLNRVASTNSCLLPDWLEKIPLPSMKKMGWINEIGPTASAKLVTTLRFFGASSLDELVRMQEAMCNAVAFKHTSTFASHALPLAAWLRQAEILAKTIHCGSWNRQALLERLPAIRALTRTKSPIAFIPCLRQLCAECGVAVVLVPTPSNCHVTAATRFLSSDKAIIVLSGRYRSDDHFWFAFFHEVAHLILHGNTELFVEDESADETTFEIEANEFAATILISRQDLRELASERLSTERLIKTARRVGVSAGILVGQLQHAGHIKPSSFNYLKRRYSPDSLFS